MLQGWLIKQGGAWKNWKRRYFILLKSGSLQYYLSKPQSLDDQLRGRLDYADIVKVTLLDDGNWSAKTKNRVWRFKSELGAKDAKKWVNTIKKCIEVSNRSDRKTQGRTFGSISRRETYIRTLVKKTNDNGEHGSEVPSQISDNAPLDDFNFAQLSKSDDPWFFTIAQVVASDPTYDLECKLKSVML